MKLTTLLFGLTLCTIPTMYLCSEPHNKGKEEANQFGITTEQIEATDHILNTPVAIPNKLDFAGETVPVHLYDVRESLDRELLVNSYWQSSTLMILKNMDRYFSIIEPILKEEGVPDDFKYLAVCESNLRPLAKSPAGAAGMWQIMSTTGRELGLEITAEVDERYHVEKATRAACKYLNSAYAKFGSWATVAASYNAGRAGMAKQISRQQTNNYFDLLLNPETGRYVYRILAFKVILSNPELYGFKLEPSEMYPMKPFVEKSITLPIEDFASYAKEQGVSYKTLKDYNPWLRQNYLRKGKNKSYTIHLPQPGFRDMIVTESK